ncbi:hypothetical protein EXIGLDRAFT_770414 [Exidia glandulosa HHB12029]|uniref:Uncharacterized protein n=1 Tax=Exidia glandulosa HHB12029 TaxID=1314781 RepID=A0A165GQC0_EXIGL|nr:hypothetical protein EXIGLDRAFT_770414 [Exidia glandulosa HHB12029]
MSEDDGTRAGWLTESELSTSPSRMVKSHFKAQEQKKKWEPPLPTRVGKKKPLEETTPGLSYDALSTPPTQDGAH